ERARTQAPGVPVRVSPARRALVYLLLALASLAVVFPLLLAFSYSFMSESEIATYPPPLLPRAPTLDNYARVLGTIPIGRYLVHSFVVSALVVLARSITANLAAFS